MSVKVITVPTPLRDGIRDLSYIESTAPSGDQNQCRRWIGALATSQHVLSVP